MKRLTTDTPAGKKMDYKELIKQLREWNENLISERCADDRLVCDDLCDCRNMDCIVLQAATAIETLLAEREAAVADLHNMHTLCMDIGGCCPECGGQIDDLLDAACSFCKGPGVSCWVKDPNDENKCAAFEWHGIAPGTGPSRENKNRRNPTVTHEGAIKILGTGSVMPGFLYTAEEFGEACRMAIAALRTQQTSTEEATEIVRCKDCERLYYKDMSGHCPHRVGPCSPDGFCERGGKRGELGYMPTLENMLECAEKRLDEEIRNGEESDITYWQGYRDAVKAMMSEQPSNTNVAPVRYGRWIGEGDGYAETGDREMTLVYDVWRCSECDHMIDDGTDDSEQLPNYCPHCGAKMDLAAAWPEEA